MSSLGRERTRLGSPFNLSCGVCEQLHRRSKAYEIARPDLIGVKSPESRGEEPCYAVLLLDGIG